jgi:UDP-N-acetyl-D-glucosamine dehydrogenase
MKRNQFYSKLKNKIKNKQAKILVIGLGYVGLKLLINLQKKFKTFGYDTDQAKIKILNKKKSPFSHISNELVKKSFNKNTIIRDLAEIKYFNIIILCLPTPLKKKNIPDLSDIKNCLKLIKEYLIEGQMIILESTTYPGTTNEIIRPCLEKKKFIIGENFFLGYSPERENPGSKIEFNKIVKICSGATKNCLSLCKNIYKQIVKVSTAQSIEHAEFTKLYENTYRSVNIGLVNEMKMLTKKMKLDIYEIIRLAKTKSFGFKAFYPGPGIGGHCIPLDPYYLSWKAKKFGFNPRFISTSGKINELTTEWVFKQTVKILKKNGKNIKNSKILIIGVAYKKNINDYRESASIKIINKLLKKGAKIDYSDTYIEKIQIKTNKNIFLKSKIVNKENVKKYNCVIILTDHDNFNYKNLLNANIIIDTRGKFKEIRHKNIYHL